MTYPDLGGGVIVATVLPFHGDGAIDWDGYGCLLDYCATPDGISAVFVNGHAGEGAALTRDERIAVIEATGKHIAGAKPLLAGIIPYSTAEAIEQARDAREAGAEVAVLFPIPNFAAGGAGTAAPVAYVRTVQEAVGLPVSIFQYALASGCGYPTDTLMEIAKLPGVIAIKEGSDTMTAYEDNYRRLKAEAPGVAMLPSNFDWFLAQCAVGADGILSGLASLAPHFLIDLWQATQAEDLKAMRAASDRLYPVVRSIYGAPPRMDMHTRIKEGLRHLGVIDSAMPRPPLLPVSADVAAGVVRAVDDADLAEYVTPPAPRRAAS